MLNRVVLVGRLTKDPELRYTPNGVAVTSITLAVNRPFSANREADFINCVVWKKQAENVANYLRKGSLTGVDGRMQTRNYENNEGKKVYITEVVADSVQFLESKNSSGSGENQGNQGGGDNYPPANQGGYPNKNQQQNQKQQNQGRNNQSLSDDPFASDGKPIDISDDDLPF